MRQAPFDDPLHKIYHLFFQSHLAQVDRVKKKGAGPAVGPVYGHAVSHDLVSWAHLPVTTPGKIVVHILTKSHHLPLILTPAFVFVFTTGAGSPLER